MKAPETFRARKAIFTSPVSENGEVYTPEISFVKRTSVYVKNTRIKQLCNHKLREFAMAFRVRKLIGTFEKRASGPVQTPLHSCAEPNLIKFDFRATAGSDGVLVSNLIREDGYKHFRGEKMHSEFKNSV